MQHRGSQVMILSTVVGTGFYIYVEAARVLGRSLSYVNKKIVCGELRRKRHDSQWMVTADSVERLLARERESAGPDLARGEASFAQVGRLWKMIQCFATCFGSATVLSWRTALIQ